MKNHEKLAISLSIGAGIGFLLNLVIGIDYKTSWKTFLMVLLINCFIWIIGELFLGLEKDKLNLAQKPINVQKNTKFISKSNLKIA